MYKLIITIFLLFFFTACENKNSFDAIIKKLESNKSVDLNNSKNIQVINKEKKKLKKQITTLTLKDVNENNISITFLKDGIKFKEFKNKIVVLDVFTTWCPPCIESIPHLNKLQKVYRKDLKVIGILMEDKIKNKALKHFIKKQNIQYTITNCKENFTLIDTWGGVSGYPTIIIFDKSGKYFNHYNGSPPYEMLESDVKKALTIKEK